MNPDSNSSTRREFLQHSSATAAGLALGSALSLPHPARAANVKADKLKLGLIGCGGRGSGAAAQALTADSNTELWAMGDVFPDKLETSEKSLGVQFKDKPGRINVADDRKFIGLDAYQKVLASGVDMVLLAAPGGFRPLHMHAAAEAGKHMFVEKPTGIDPTGVRTVHAAAELARRKGLAVRQGFAMRYDLAYREAIKRVHDGQIGDVVAIYSTRMSNRLSRFDGSRKPEWGDLEWQLRNWHLFLWLSGDWIMEVSVHSVDKILWAMQNVPPVKCHASGARWQQTVGNVWDQFDVTYTWENGAFAVLKTRYMDKCHNQHDDLIIGTKGRCYLRAPLAEITGANPWKYSGPRPAMHQVEHDELFADLRAGRIPNDGESMANSTLAGIMGRMSAYTGKEVTWEMALNSQLDTMPKNLAWDMKLDVPPFSEPGKTPFV
ncbi:MAG: Gfo/Idh/MocA family oxidoreductase [Verrucomicrobia bacterium]|nr:Gfo/Idh/MocA family oxidoreductase [Verrucomicrobiota bacterium]